MPDVHVRNFMVTRRGPSSAILIRDDDGSLYLGTIFFEEVTGPDSVNTAIDAIAFVESNVVEIMAGLKVAVDDGIYPGWSRDPRVEQTMLYKALEEAGWG